MARTAIAAQVPKGPFISGQPAAGALDVAETAADVANGNLFIASGADFLIVHNTDVGAQNFSISSMPDGFGRSQDVTNYSVAAGKISVFSLRDTRGWMQADGNIYINAASANVKFAILKIQ
jgi:hypothetical protein